MATVIDKAGISPLDKKYSTPNRQNAGTPVGSLTPLYPNELVLDTTNGLYYKAIGKTNNDWQLVNLKQNF